MIFIECIKNVEDLYSKGVSFTKGNIYKALLGGNNLIVEEDDNNTSHIVAYSVMHRWYEDPWFEEHFKIIE